jgi:hypothetical protein
MNTSLLAQAECKGLVVLCESNPHTGDKHIAACKTAHKAYLHAMYGYQPSQEEIGVVSSIAVNGTVVVVEVRFILWGATELGMFELPLHVFKQDGKVVNSTAQIKDLVGRLITMSVARHYQFDGISLSNVVAVDFNSMFDLNKYGRSPARMQE